MILTQAAIDKRLKLQRQQMAALQGKVSDELARVMDQTLQDLQDQILIEWAAMVAEAADAGELDGDGRITRLLDLANQVPATAAAFVAPQDPNAEVNPLADTLATSKVLPLTAQVSDIAGEYWRAAVGGQAGAKIKEAMPAVSEFVVGGAFDNNYSLIREITEEKQKEFRDLFVDAILQGRDISLSSKAWQQGMTEEQAREAIARGDIEAFARAATVRPGSIEDTIIKSGHLPLFPKSVTLPDGTVKQVRRYYSIEERAAMTAITETTRLYTEADAAMAATLGFSHCWNWLNPVAAGHHADICLAATAAGVVTVEEMRDTYGAPPRHVNCKCSLEYVDKSEATTAEKQQRAYNDRYGITPEFEAAKARLEE